VRFAADREENLMKKKNKEKPKRDNHVTPQVESFQPKFLRQCGRVLLISASYQIFSLCTSPSTMPDSSKEPDAGHKRLFGTVSSHMPSVFTDMAEAQIKGKCVGGCIGCTGCTGCTGSTGGSYAPAYDPVAEQHNRAHDLNEEGVRQSNNKNFSRAIDYYREALRLWPEDQVIQRNLRKAEQALLNEEGVKYYNNKDWAKATDYFRQALSKFPENDTVRNNLQNAEDALQQEKAEKERERQEAQTAADMRKTINNMGSLFNSPAPASSGLEFSGKPATPPSSGGLDFMPATPAQPPQPAVPATAGQRKVGSLEGNRAIQEAEANLSATQQGKSGAVFDSKGDRAPQSLSPVGAVSAAGQPTQMSERARKDPRMITAQKELTDLQEKRQKLDEQRSKLTKDLTSTSDPAKMKQLVKQLDKAEKDYQANLLAVSNQSQKVEKLKRTIDVEVESPAEPSSKGGAQ
jgi:tetratricopeptide (TPR) repeat protein